jgi:hypothetical protein
LFLLPLAVLVWNALKSGHRISRPLVVYIFVIVAALVVTCFPAAKPGSGSYHLLPFLVPIVHAYFWLRSELPESRRDAAISGYAVPLVVTALFYSTVSSLYFWNSVRSAPAASATLAEIREVEREFKGQRIELGYGDDHLDRATWYRYQTIFDGHPYTLDSVQMADLQFGGVAIPEATIRYIESCQTGVWLIPKGKAPFTLTNGFFGEGHPLLDDRFRNAFSKHYRLAEQGKIFDRWTSLQDRCKMFPN